MNNSRRSFIKKAGLGFLYLATACTKEDIYVGESDFVDDDMSPDVSNPINKATFRDTTWKDIFTKKIYDTYNEQFKNEDDYSNKIYIDPDYTGSDNNGSIEAPYTSFWDAMPSQTNTAYLVKRGTTHSVSNPDSLWINSDDIMIGAYGHGERPRMTDKTFNVSGNRALLRDIHVDVVRMGQYGQDRGNDSILFNCKFDGRSENVIFGLNNRVIGCEITKQQVNGLFVQQMNLDANSNFEMAYCHIHKVNQRWFGDGTPQGRIPQTPAGGDCLHLATRFQGHFWIHHNILDRSDTGNKFCIIVNMINVAVNVTGVIEENICYGPMSDPDSGNILYIDAGLIPFQNIVIRNNVLIGNYDDYSDTWTSTAIYVIRSEVFIYGNIIANCKMALHRYNNDGGDSYFYNNTTYNITGPLVISAVIAKLYNNIMAHSGYNASGSPETDNNLFLDEPGNQPENIFVNTGSENFTLKNNSPAIGGGTWESFMDREWKTDLLGNPIPHDNSINLGCFQKPK